jgi:hypothetical protein
MERPPPNRALGDLTFVEISRHLKETSILCLPIGAIGSTDLRSTPMA